jgi:ATP-binding cassette subfamily B (MDR/TAP) protein 1
VVFCYPTAPAYKVCNGYSLEIQAGQVCALCGPSGSGKSTIIALLQRFYDPRSGDVLIDGADIKSLNVKWLRQQLGLVGQEPVLFEGTVAQNIGYGKDGATQAEIEEAAKAANAHDFILNDLGEGYTTQVGLRGGKLSGGQKQRVAIARALVRKPSIMLLDEATSALDNTSEKVVQAALDEIMSKQKRTTITIAHRLSTIRGADTIAVVNQGQVVEQGSHDELLKIGPKGVYFQLVQAQQ